MEQDLFDVLKRSTPAEARQQLNLSARDLDAQVLQLTASVNGQGESPESQAVIAYVNARIGEPSGETECQVPPLNLTPELEGLRQWVCGHYRALQQQYLTPEVLEWARRTFDEEVHLAGLREIEATGGVDIKDLLYDLEQEATPRE
jgi:hypothetical protein